MLFADYVSDLSDAVVKTPSDENSADSDFMIECLGILGNLSIPELDFELLLKEYQVRTHPPDWESLRKGSILFFFFNASERVST